MTEPEITCHQLVEMVTEYLEDAMEPAERDRLELHLSQCTRCRRYLDQMRHTITVTGELREEAVSPEAREDLLNVFRAWKQR